MEQNSHKCPKIQPYLISLLFSPSQKCLKLYHIQFSSRVPHLFYFCSHFLSRFLASDACKPYRSKLGSSLSQHLPHICCPFHQLQSAVTKSYLLRSSAQLIAQRFQCKLSARDIPCNEKQNKPFHAKNTMPGSSSIGTQRALSTA